MLASSLLRAIGPCGKATRSPTTRAEWLAVRYPTAGTFPQGQAACWRRQKDARLLVPRNVPEVARGPYYSCAPTRPARAQISPGAAHALTSESGHPARPINAFQKYDIRRGFLGLALVAWGHSWQ